MNRFSKIALVGLFAVLTSCGNAPKEEATNENNVAPISSDNHLGVEYAIKDLLNQSITSDTVQHYTNDPFLFFKTGNLFDLNFRTSLALICPTDSTFQLRVYKMVDSAWQYVDSLDGLKANRAQFFIESKDYNFDKQADLYIQYRYTDGYPMSMGSVILVDPLTKTISLHKGASNLLNISIEPNTKILRAEAIYEGPVAKGEEKIWVKRYTWKGKQMNILDSTLELISQKN